MQYTFQLLNSFQFIKRGGFLFEFLINQQFSLHVNYSSQFFPGFNIEYAPSNFRWEHWMNSDMQIIDPVILLTHADATLREFVMELVVQQQLPFRVQNFLNYYPC